ncbi:MAG: hypothetical protein JOS17DRAFT_478829 [Linnemannia elongata]|nr:MAG: hypothetical protein JOS17DRAFT_478829 [Linnemannia elongata]
MSSRQQAFTTQGMESTKKDKGSAIEIGGFYAIIGKDLREYRVEVLGKRVSELETLVYIHYDGTDKRLDEWVDVTRLTPLKDQKKATIRTTGGPATPGSSATTGSPTSATDASEAGGRPKRKAIKDEVAALLESMKRPTSRMTRRARSGREPHQAHQPTRTRP